MSTGKVWHWSREIDSNGTLGLLIKGWRSAVSVRPVEGDADVFAVIGPVAEFQTTIKRLSTAKLTTLGIGQIWPAMFVMFVRANNQAAVESAVCESAAISPS